MSGVTIKASRKNFFDRKVVTDAVTKRTADALRLGGGLIRKIMRRSIRSGGANQTASRPGEPPRTHGKQLLKRLIHFHFVRGNVFKDHRVWIGPVRSNSPTGAPEILEFGGTVHLKKGTPIRVEARTDKKGYLRGGKFVPGPERTIRIEPRPYLGPALDKAVASGRLPGYWKNATIGGG